MEYHVRVKVASADSKKEKKKVKHGNVHGADCATAFDDGATREGNKNYSVRVIEQ